MRFYFVTRCYYDYMETILRDFMEQPVPDVVFMSSCCWDVTRYVWWLDHQLTLTNCLLKDSLLSIIIQSETITLPVCEKF